MNTVKEELQTKTLAETKLELIEWILTINDIDIINYLIQQREEIEKADKQRRFLALFGAWESDETADELIEKIYKSRMDSRRDIEL